MWEARVGTRLGKVTRRGQKAALNGKTPDVGQLLPRAAPTRVYLLLLLLLLYTCCSHPATCIRYIVLFSYVYMAISFMFLCSSFSRWPWSSPIPPYKRPVEWTSPSSLISCLPLPFISFVFSYIHLHQRTFVKKPLRQRQSPMLSFVTCN